MSHLHPALPYAYNALEPHIDAQTMEFHHQKHHGSAVDTLNKSIAGTDAEHKTVEAILAIASTYPAAIRNSAGSHYNHSSFWQVLTPTPTQPAGALAAAIEDSFGSLDGLKEKMNAAGIARFGSGWVWLIVKDGKLEITSSANQDNPLMDTAEVRGTPILGIDIWEHAYYLKYQNRRPEYLTNIWNVINWDEVGRRYEAAM
ncbi:MAG: superoxide dismutase [Bacteroidetes bacterium]|nr:superoxide dismutase [Bacteroidota bacterium]